MRFSPRRSWSAVSARACATRARRRTLPSLFRGDLQEDFLQRTAPGLQRRERDVLVAKETGELGDPGGRARGADDVLAGPVLDDFAVAESERLRDREDVEPGCRPRTRSRRRPRAG